MNILFIGDIFGNPGRKISKEVLPSLIREYNIDFCIANGENAAGGSGITYTVAQELYKLGIDAITLGNHTWSKKEIINFIDSDKKIIRPANYPLESPGRGSAVIEKKELKIGVVNVLGRVYMDIVDCPFKAADREIEYLKQFVKIVLVDIHAEATSEKAALAWYLDGRVSCVYGTHTHVQTSDERILPCGTSFITDVGMTGPYDGILGVDRNIIIERFLTHLPAKFEVAKGKAQFNGIVADIDDNTGKTRRVKRITIIRDV
ncbi:MAG TPA: TIGR00282 family metallophosphoesterase [Clostridiaceae bacterium]|nr:TIGR00282 family metallophosphoesterase [Clostridiaceae bacterium]